MRRSMYGWIAAVAAGLAAAAMPASAGTLQLHTNEAYVEEVSRTGTLAIGDPLAVFAAVFGALPDRVKVYPTENYYYFAFAHAGLRYAGNIRLDTSDRDRGIVHFGYFEEQSDWSAEDSDVSHVALDATKGVTVEKQEPLVYKVSYGGKSVVFALNDLSGVTPPAAALAPDERFIGPIFDESGIRFFLVYNGRLKLFHYVLDETVPVADAFVAAPRAPRILVGKRTGFAFYRDHLRARKILIGAAEINMKLNNYFDGPFDQLPDNFVEGETLRAAILEVSPELKGEIDRFGGSADGSQRFMIGPYLPYRRVEDVLPVDRCAAKRQRAPAYYACFVSDAGPGNDVGPRTRPTDRRKSRRAAPPQ